MKQCCTCRLLKNEKEFYKDKRNPDGLYPRCKSCHLSACAKYRDKNPDAGRLWRNKNRKYLLTQKKLDYKKNKEKYDARNREWAIKHKETLKEYNKIYSVKNRKRIRSLARKYRKQNIEKIKSANIEHHRLTREALVDYYVKTLLLRQSILRANKYQIPERLIQIKRKQIKLKRLINEKRNKIPTKNVTR